MGYHVCGCCVVHRNLRRLSGGESFGTPALFVFITLASLLFPRCFGHLGVLIRMVRGRLDFICAGADEDDRDQVPERAVYRDDIRDTTRR